jgi:hypothetical protein
MTHKRRYNIVYTTYIIYKGIYIYIYIYMTREILILRSRILRFPRFYALISWFRPNTCKKNVTFSGLYVYQLYVVPEFTLQFRSSDYRIYPISRFIVFFSELLSASVKSKLATSQCNLHELKVEAVKTYTK